MILQLQKMQLKYYPFLKVGFVFQYDGCFCNRLFGLLVVSLCEYAKLSSIHVLSFRVTRSDHLLSQNNN